MEWYLVAFLALFLLAAIAFWLVRQQQAHAERVGLDRLERRLVELGVDPGEESTPPAELLRLHIQESDSILAATRAQCDDKRAILVLLDDRIVYVAASVGRLGCQAQSISYDRINAVEGEPHVGGNLRLETAHGSVIFTHIPQDNFSDIVRTLNQRVRHTSEVKRPLQPGHIPST
jgi:hypothetical protein